MQPSILPWGGFFSLASKVQHFVILDAVQYSKGSSHNRFFLNHEGAKVTYSVPVFHKSITSKLLMDIKIRTDLYPKSLIKKLEQSYRSTSASSYMILSETTKILGIGHTKLLDLNIDLIKYIFHRLNIQSTIHLSSELLPRLDYSDPVSRLLDILKVLNASHYIMPSRSLDYALPNLPLFHQSGILTSAVYYNQCSYSHRSGTFIPNISILDMMMNEDETQWRNCLSDSTKIRLIT